MLSLSVTALTVSREQWPADAVTVGAVAETRKGVEREETRGSMQMPFVRVGNEHRSEKSEAEANEGDGDGGMGGRRRAEEESPVDVNVDGPTAQIRSNEGPEAGLPGLMNRAKFSGKRESSTLEAQTTVDFSAPEGFLWQPTSMTGLNCEGNSVCEAKIRYCMIDIRAYQENPWKFPMAVMLQKHSHCNAPRNQRLYLLSALRVREGVGFPGMGGECSCYQI